MKRISLLLTVALITICTVGAKAQSITGYWFDEVKDAKIHIYQAKDHKYYGKIVWLKEPMENGKPKLDTKNDDKNLRSRPVMGLMILTGFVKDGDKYVDGTIYDPKSGNTYSCKITPQSDNKLHIRGYVGVSIFGRTTYWTRTTFNQK